MTTGKALLIIAGAASAGIILGMLLSQDKGSVMQKSIKDQGTKALCTLGDMIRKGMVQYQEIKSVVSAKLSGLQMSRGKFRYN